MIEQEAQLEKCKRLLTKTLNFLVRTREAVIATDYYEKNTNQRYQTWRDKLGDEINDLLLELK